MTAERPPNPWWPVMMGAMVAESGIRQVRPRRVTRTRWSPHGGVPAHGVGAPARPRPARPAGDPTVGREGPGRWEIRLPAQPPYAHVARHLVRAALRSHGGPVRRVVEEAVLLVSELVGNVVRHTGAPEFALRAWCAGGRLRIEVEDCSRALPSLLPEAPLAEGGRGLLLVDHFATRWGVDLLPHGKRTWCELAW